VRVAVTGGCIAHRKLAKRAGMLTVKGERGKGKGKLLVALTDDITIRAINKQFLKKDRATDVLSFIYGDEDVYGETIISLDRAKAQAEEYGVTFREELGRLVIHGILHLLGYRDESPSERECMRQKEDLYLSKLI
jgi:rRNA maturation RNase YbeY